MSSIDKRVNMFSFASKITIALAVCFAFGFTNCQDSAAQFNNFTNGVVGGVNISPDGVLNGERTALPKDALKQLRDNVSNNNVDMEKVGLRMVSTKGLEAAYRKSVKEGQIPAAVRYMAGLQRIEYIIRTDDDIILAGPAEPIHVDGDGNVVGKESGMPVLNTEDFIIALRHANNARQGQGVSVSIDPTEEGVKNYQELVNEMRRKRMSFHPDHAPKVEEAYGPQTIRLSGVPKNSRFAQILVSADYKMKRLAMGLEQTPDFLPSLLHMAKAKNKGFGNAAPRYWMECNYEPCSVSSDKDVWKLNGTGVKTLAQETKFDSNGNRMGKGKTNKMAKRWADMMTEKFAQLSKVEPVFRELRNLMDMSVVAAIITKENMMKKSNIEAPSFTSAGVPTPEWNVPAKVPSQCSFVKIAGSTIFTASGGVTVDSFGVAEKTKVDDSLSKMIAKVDVPADRWWWNAK